MERFQNNQKVRVVAPEGGEARKVLTGRTGEVVRLRMADEGAWVAMDEALPRELRSFCDGDDRQDHILLYPDECEAVAVKAVKT